MNAVGAADSEDDASGGPAGRQLEDGPVHPGRVALGQPRRRAVERHLHIGRITSYNVCYTKLLRSRRCHCRRAAQEGTHVTLETIFGPGTLLGDEPALMIAGERRVLTDVVSTPVINPATGGVIAEVPHASEETVDEAA